ncbi:MAG: type II toxin-antitoxin system Phd/YefM family antitoxin [Deltaproteobacteria bacterium]|nr:type II toxin-antitoxin system Phd/YefM family antitoxin [Deltaproteobacteria bacterium]
MTKLNIHEAKTHLSRYLKKVAEGEEILLCKNGHPVAKIIPFPPKKPRRLIGLLKGKIKLTPEFFEPLTDEEFPGIGL